MQGFPRIFLCAAILFMTGCVSTSLVQTLMDDVEHLKKDNKILKKKVAKLDKDVETIREDLDRVRSDAEPESITPTPAISVEPTPSPVAAPLALNDEAWYGRGQDLYHADKYREAARAFEQAAILSKSPEMSARCYYWLGECFYSLGAYDRALSFFYRVTDEFPSQSKAPDAMLKIGFTYTELKDYNRAVKILKDFIKAYPTHRAVALAEEKIQWIETVRSEGGSVDSTDEEKESRS